MTSKAKWTRIGLAGTLAVSLLGAPQIAAAGEHYGRTSDYRGYQTYYDRGHAYNAPSYYRDYGNRNGYYDDHGYYHRRSAGKSAAIIGGSAAAGAVIGAMAGGGKGAAIGAAIGGIGGLIFDKSTKHKGRH